MLERTCGKCGTGKCQHFAGRQWRCDALQIMADVQRPQTEYPTDVRLAEVSAIVKTTSQSLPFSSMYLGSSFYVK